MDYNLRLQIAAVCSLVLHGAALLVGEFSPRQEEPIPLSEREVPLVLNLQAAEEDKTLRLVERGAPAEEPVENTDLISDLDTKAQDDSEVEGEKPQPFFEEASDGEELGNPEAAEPSPPVRPPVAGPTMEIARARTTPIAPKESDLEAVDQETELELLSEGVLKLTDALEERKEASERPETLEGGEEAPQVEPLPEQFEVAKLVEAPALALPPDPGVTRGRAGGGVSSSGFTSFEANKHEMGEYMLHIRKRVERAWRTALLLRYSGTTPTAALIECAISPDGEVVSVIIIEPGTSVSYAYLCKEAIEKSGPFNAFPFEVPEIYRSKNLEIRWRFSFL